MQTFLPYPDFQASAACLDDKRLGKQRVEVLQILNALLADGGWRNHPATRMWEGHEHALASYGITVCETWVQRGIDNRGVPYKDTCADKIRGILWDYMVPFTGDPDWLGLDEFHASHRSQLLGKNPEWYSQFGWHEPPGTIEYFWPNT